MALADDAFEGESEARGVVAAALVEPEALLVKAEKDMERFNGHVGALDGALEERPEGFAPLVSTFPST